MDQRITRRQLFQTTAATAAGTFGLPLHAGALPPGQLRTEHTTKTHSVCPYCAVGCSVILHTLGDGADNVHPSLVHVEGDPGSPVNGGTLCSKGIALKEYVNSERRLTRPLVREAGSSSWASISWDEAISRMARRIKDSRDAGFEAVDAEGRTVNRLTSVGMIGGCTDTNEINYLLGKLRFGLGILPYENQARL